MTANTHARVTLRLDFPTDFRLGPGKVRLLELVDELGSISAAGRAMGMAYRRAWLLIDSLNRGFRRRVVETSPGGRQGGGATLTSFGHQVIARYRAMEKAAVQAVATHVRALEAEVSKTAGRQPSPPPDR